MGRKRVLHKITKRADMLHIPPSAHYIPDSDRCCRSGALCFDSFRPGAAQTPCRELVADFFSSVGGTTVKGLMGPPPQGRKTREPKFTAPVKHEINFKAMTNPGPVVSHPGGVRCVHA